MLTNASKWFFFTFLFALIPLGLRAAFLYGGSKDFDIRSLLVDGEVFLLSCIVVASTLGEVFNCNHLKPSIRLHLITWLSVSFVLFSAALYGYYGTVVNKETIDLVKLTKMCSATLFLALICGFGCIYITENNGDH